MAEKACIKRLQKEYRALCKVLFSSYSVPILDLSVTGIILPIRFSFFFIKCGFFALC